MKTIFFCLTLATCRLYAQHQDTLALRHLPPDADAIYRFNLPVITSKLAWQDLADRIPFPQQNTSARELAAILKEPFRAGVDPGKDIFWTDITAPATRFTAPCLSIDPTPGPGFGSSAADTLHIGSLLLHLVDSNRFTAFLRDLEPGIHISSQDSMSSAGRNGMGAAWNKSILVLSFITPVNPAQSHSHHTTLAIRQSLTMLKGYPDTVRILDPLFLQGFIDDADIDAWTVPGKISSLLLQFLLRLDKNPDYPRLALADGKKIRVLTTLRFEKGQVTVKSITTLPPGVSDAWARLIAHPPAGSPQASASDRSALPATPDPTTSPTNPDSSSTLAINPTPSPAEASGVGGALLHLHINPRAIGDLLDSLHARGQTEALLFDKGLSLENFVHAFQGDLLLAVTTPDSTHLDHTTRDILTASTPVLPDHNAVASDIGRSASSPHTTPDRPSLYAAIPLQDLTAFWQWMGRLKWLTASPGAQDSGYGNIHTIVGRHIPAWLVKDNCLIIAPDHQHALNWCIPPPAAPTDPTTTSDPNQPPCVLCLRINLKNMAALTGHSLDQLLFTAGRLNANNQIENVLRITLTDPSQNSLRILFRLLE